MKRQIRRGVFETNSSSTHSMTICSETQYNEWFDNNNIYFHKYDEKFDVRENIISTLRRKMNPENNLCYPDIDWNNSNEVDKIILENNWMTNDQYWESIDHSTNIPFCEFHTTPGGEKIVAFGYAGYDC